MAQLLYNPMTGHVGIAATAKDGGGANIPAIIQAVTLTDAAGNQPSSVTTPGDAEANAAPAQVVYSRGYVFNGTTWTRQRGDTIGTDAVISVRPTAGGLTQFRRLATADTNLAVVKASAGRVYGYTMTNLTATVKFVKLYNKATAPVLASDVPLRTIAIPPNGVAAYTFAAGLAGFSAGIAIAATGGVADTDATALAANDVVIQIDYA